MTKVETNAINTNIPNIFLLIMPAFKPTVKTTISTIPLHDIKTPAAVASLQNKPVSLAVRVPEIILVKMAIPIVAKT